MILRGRRRRPSVAASMMLCLGIATILLSHETTTATTTVATPTPDPSNGLRPIAALVQTPVRHPSPLDRAQLVPSTHLEPLPNCPGAGANVLMGDKAHLAPVVVEARLSNLRSWHAPAVRQRPAPYQQPDNSTLVIEATFIVSKVLKQQPWPGARLRSRHRLKLLYKMVASSSTTAATLAQTAPKQPAPTSSSRGNNGKRPAPPPPRPLSRQDGGYGDNKSNNQLDRSTSLCAFDISEFEPAHDVAELFRFNTTYALFLDQATAGADGDDSTSSTSLVGSAVGNAGANDDVDGLSATTGASFDVADGAGEDGDGGGGDDDDDNVDVGPSSAPSSSSTFSATAGNFAGRPTATAGQQNQQPRQHQPRQPQPQQPPQRQQQQVGAASPQRRHQAISQPLKEHQLHSIATHEPLTRETRRALRRILSEICGALAPAPAQRARRDTRQQSGAGGADSETALAAVTSASAPPTVGGTPPQPLVKNITAQNGQSVLLHCLAEQADSAASGAGVSWFRGAGELQLLTYDANVIVQDDRFAVRHTPLVKGDWALQIKNLDKASDAGLYQCQTGGDPPRSQYYQLNVVEPQVRIVGAPDLAARLGQRINLTCVISQSPDQLQYIFWYRDKRMINYDIIGERGKIVVAKVAHRPDTITSNLQIYAALQSDAGNYTCAPSGARPHSIQVHVLEGNDKRLTMFQNDHDLQLLAASSAPQTNSAISVHLVRLSRGRVYALFLAFTICSAWYQLLAQTQTAISMLLVAIIGFFLGKVTDGRGGSSSSCPLSASEADLKLAAAEAEAAKRAPPKAKDLKPAAPADSLHRRRRPRAATPLLAKTTRPQQLKQRRPGDAGAQGAGLSPTVSTGSSNSANSSPASSSSSSSACSPGNRTMSSSCDEPTTCDSGASVRTVDPLIKRANSALNLLRALGAEQAPAAAAAAAAKNNNNHGEQQTNSARPAPPSLGAPPGGRAGAGAGPAATGSPRPACLGRAPLRSPSCSAASSASTGYNSSTDTSPLARLVSSSCGPKEARRRTALDTSNAPGQMIELVSQPTALHLIMDELAGEAGGASLIAPGAPIAAAAAACARQTEPEPHYSAPSASYRPRPPRESAASLAVDHASARATSNATCDRHQDAN